MCRELGLNFGMRYNIKFKEKGEGPIFALSAKCRGFERSLSACDLDLVADSVNDTSATCETDAAVSCSKLTIFIITFSIYLYVYVLLYGSEIGDTVMILKV